MTKQLRSGAVFIKFDTLQTVWDESWYSQYVFSYDAQDHLERIVLQYTDEQGQPTGQERLTYLRLPKGESLATVEARVKSLLLQAIETTLDNIPQEEKLYCLLLCYTHEDLGAAWPPFLREVLNDGEKRPQH